MHGTPDRTDGMDMPTTTTYCVVPKNTDPSVVEELRLKYADDTSVVVVLDDREGEGEPSSEVLRLRRPVLRRDLPGGLIPGARLEQHMPPVDLALADQSLDSIIAAAIAHDPAASSELRWRCYALVLIQLTDRLGSRAAAHQIVPRVMDAVQEALPTYPAHGDFSRWLIALIARLPLDV